MGTTTKNRNGIVLSVAALKAAFSIVKSAVTDRTPRPILRNVLISGGQVVGTDLEVQVTAAVPFDGPALLLPFARVWSILTECRDDEITITPQDTSCVLSTKRGSWTLPTEDPAEFPTMTAEHAANRIKLPADQFAGLVHAVVEACDMKSTRYALGGVMVEVKGDKVSVVATDGRRLTMAEAEHDLAVDDSETLIPQRVAKLLAEIAKEAGGEELVELEASTNTLVCTIGSTVVTARLVEGRFPPWRDVFPTNSTKATTVSRGLLADATRAAAITTSESSKGVDFSFSKEGLHLHAQSSEAGESSVTCDIVEFGNAATVKLDPKFLLDFLAGLAKDSEPDVEIQAAKPGDAVRLKCGDVHGVIMPLAE
jgi:DNA polymerase-3 subunit beta